MAPTGLSSLASSSCKLVKKLLVDPSQVYQTKDLYNHEIFHCYISAPCSFEIWPSRFGDRTQCAISNKRKMQKIAEVCKSKQEAKDQMIDGFQIGVVGRNEKSSLQSTEKNAVVDVDH